jgi:hypothetical protein
MSYILRFVQRYRPADEKAFLNLEAKFAALEKRHRSFPKGRRSRPYAGREPAHTLVWECEFETLAAAQKALDRMSSSSEHARLLNEQVQFFLESFTEIYEVLELGG